MRKKRKTNGENHGTFKSKKSKDNENPFTNFLDESDVDDEVRFFYKILVYSIFRSTLHDLKDLRNARQ